MKGKIFHPASTLFVLYILFKPISEKFCNKELICFAYFKIQQQKYFFFRTSQRAKVTDKTWNWLSKKATKLLYYQGMVLVYC